MDGVPSRTYDETKVTRLTEKKPVLDSPSSLASTASDQDPHGGSCSRLSTKQIFQIQSSGVHLQPAIRIPGPNLPGSVVVELDAVAIWIP
jgi:hypothetical protein